MPEKLPNSKWFYRDERDAINFITLFLVFIILALILCIWSFFPTYYINKWILLILSLIIYFILYFSFEKRYESKNISKAIIEKVNRLKKWQRIVYNIGIVVYIISSFTSFILSIITFGLPIEK